MRLELGEIGSIEPVREGEGAASAMLSRIQTMRSSFWTWRDLIKTLGSRKQYED